MINIDLGKMRALILFIVLSLIGTRLCAQLNGTYTVGDSTLDFPSLNRVMDTLQDRGISGNVRLLLKDGEYDGVYFSYFKPTFKLTLSSLTSNSIDVRIDNIQVSQSQNIEFRNLEVNRNSIQNEFSTVNISSSLNIRFVRCRLIDNLSYQLDYEEAVLKITENSVVQIDSSFVSGISGYFPSEIFRIVLFDEGGITLHLNRDSILGKFTTGHGLRNWEECYLKIDSDLGYDNVDVFKNCILDFTSGFNGDYTLEGTGLDSCRIMGFRPLICRMDLSNSHIYMPFEMDFSRLAYSGNKFYNTIKGASSNGKFSGNMCFKKTDLPGGMTIINNFFFAKTTLNGDGTYFYNNSFTKGAQFISFGKSDIVNNCFSNCDGEKPRSFDRNNFAANDPKTLFWSTYDGSPTFHDPMYVDSLDLHILNPALFSRGRIQIQVPVDFDLQPRGSIRSVGADETCLNFPFPDSVVVDCGTDYILKSCVDNIKNKYRWKPGTAFLDSTVAFPQVLVSKPTLIWYEDSLANIIDSLYILPGPIHTMHRTIEIPCGNPALLRVILPQNAKVTWSPSHYFKDSTAIQQSPILHNDQKFVASIDNGICGITKDTTQVIVDQRPTGHWDIDTLKCLSAHFNVYNDCYDSVFWNFGDGTYGTGSPIWHTFPNDSVYKVSITKWNKGLTYSFTSYAHIYCASSKVFKSTNFKLFPNPCDEKLNIELSERQLNSEFRVSDPCGRILIRGTANERTFCIPIQDLSQGTYVIQIDECSTWFIKE